MPIRPPAYDVPEGGGASGTGASYSRQQGGESVVKGGGSFQLVHDTTVSDAFKNIGKIATGLTEAFEKREKAILDNEVLSNYLEITVGVDQINRRLREEGVRSGDYMSEWMTRTQALSDAITKKTSSKAQGALTKKALPYLIEQRLKAGMATDGLLKDETVSNVANLQKMSEDQAANLFLPDKPLIRGSKDYAFGLLADYNEYVDIAASRGLLSLKEAADLKLKGRESAYFARAERLAFDVPGEYIRRSGDPNDPVISVLDPNKKKLLDKRAEERVDYLRRQRLQDEDRQVKVTTASQERWHDVVFKSMEEAFQTKQPVGVYEQEIKSLGHLIGDDKSGKLYMHLRTLQAAERERDKREAKQGDDRGYAVWLDRVLSGKVRSPLDIHLAAGKEFDYDHADELVRSWYAKHEDDRKTEIEANARFIKTQLSENIGIVAKFNKQAALAESRALREFELGVHGDRGLRGPKLQQYADEIVSRWTKSIQTTIAVPDALRNSLPIIDGKRLETEQDIIRAWNRGKIRQTQADEYIGLLRYIGTVKEKQAGEKTKADESKAPEAEEGSLERRLKGFFGSGGKKTDEQGLRKPKGNP